MIIKKINKVISSVIIIVFILGMFSGCERGDKKADKGFRFPLVSEPKQIDPQSSSNASAITVITSLFEGLTKLDKDSKPVPGMAEWEVSSDGLVYTFKIRESFWNDHKTKDEEGKEIVGTRVSANDFIFGFKRSLLATREKSFALQLFDIKNAREIYQEELEPSELGVKAIDTYTLEITLTEANPDFLSKLASSPFMPCNEKFFEKTAGRYGMAQEHLLTNGPFRLRSWEPDESLLLNRNVGYYGLKEIRPAAVRYVIGKVEDPIYSVSEGLLDAAPISMNETEKALEYDLVLHEQSDTVKFLLFNNKNEHLASLDIRTVLRDVIEWDILNKELNSDISEVAKGFVSSESKLTSGEKYRTDGNALTNYTDNKKIERAKTKWHDYLSEHNLDSMPSIKIVCADDEYSVAVARIIAQSWQKYLSFYCELDLVPVGELSGKIKEGYDVAIQDITASGVFADDALKSFSTYDVANITKFSDESFDNNLIEVLQGGVNREEIELLEEFLWDKCPAIPLSYEKRTIVLSKDSEGIIVRPFDGGIFGAPFDFINAGKKD